MLGDHLGSSSVVLDGDGGVRQPRGVHPYGETSFGSFARKRYRFTGKERDEESGLGYHGARYYAPWLGRWTSCDPDRRRPHRTSSNSYTGLGGNPSTSPTPAAGTRTSPR